MLWNQVLPDLGKCDFGKLRKFQNLDILKSQINHMEIERFGKLNMWKIKKKQWKIEKCDFRPLEGRNRPRDCDFRNLRVKLYRIPKFSSKSVPWGPLPWPFEGIHVYTHVIRNPPRVSHDAICFLNHGFQIRNHLTLHAPTQVSYSMSSPYSPQNPRKIGNTPQLPEK